MQYAEVLVDTPTDRRSFHYAIPPEVLSEISTGSFVRVPFRGKEIDGVVVAIANRLPRGLSKQKLRTVSRVIRKEALPRDLLRLADWMAEYYLASFSDALFALLPPFPQRQYSFPMQHEERRERIRSSQTYFVHGRENDRWKQYIRAIEKSVSVDHQVVILFPDTARATRFIRLINQSLSIKTILFSADLPKAQRFRTWERIQRGEYDLVVGTRLAVFAPAPNLGLLIVDEESHPGHKDGQHPRYHAREVAAARAKLTGATLLLGNLLPTLPTFQGIDRGQIKSIELSRKSTPTTIVDMKTIRSPLSPVVEEELSKAKQGILFTTHLGVGAATYCLDCRYLFRCPNCTLPLTLHGKNVLQCHHCGHTEPLPATCPNCGSTRLHATVGGTEGLEQHLAERFPGRTIERLEAPLRRGSRGQAELTLSDHWDILVTTVKLLDTTFTAPVVAVHSLDTILELPDPFAVERVAQLLVQLRDRAMEQFLVQTRTPDHRVFRVLENEEQFLTEELALRRSKRYPPAVRLVRILAHGEDRVKIATDLTNLATQLKRKLSPKLISVLGPGPAFYEKLKGKFRWHLLLKIYSDDRKLRQKIRSLLPDNVTIDVNPIDIL